MIGAKSTKDKTKKAGQLSKPRLSFVYILQGELGPVKIGFTTSLNQRMSVLRTGGYIGMRILRLIEGGKLLEQWFHERFAANHRAGEWFTFDPDMLTVVPPVLTEAPKEIRDPSFEKILIELQKILKAVADTAPPGATLHAKITHVAERLGFKRSRIKNIWYGEVNTVSATEADQIRSAHLVVLRERDAQLRQETKAVKSELRRVQSTTQQDLFGDISRDTYSKKE
jgi:hypothetical protein